MKENPFKNRDLDYPLNCLMDAIDVKGGINDFIDSINIKTWKIDSYNGKYYVENKKGSKKKFEKALNTVLEKGFSKEQIVAFENMRQAFFDNFDARSKEKINSIYVEHKEVKVSTMRIEDIKNHFFKWFFENYICDVLLCDEKSEIEKKCNELNRIEEKRLAGAFVKFNISFDDIKSANCHKITNDTIEIFDVFAKASSSFQRFFRGLEGKRITFEEICKFSLEETVSYYYGGTTPNKKKLAIFYGFLHELGLEPEWADKKMISLYESEWKEKIEKIKEENHEKETVF